MSGKQLIISVKHKNFREINTILYDIAAFIQINTESTIFAYS